MHFYKGNKKCVSVSARKAQNFTAIFTFGRIWILLVFFFVYVAIKIGLLVAMRMQWLWQFVHSIFNQLYNNNKNGIIVTNNNNKYNGLYQMWSFGILTIKVCFMNSEWLQNEKKWITKTKSNKNIKKTAN